MTPLVYDTTNGAYRVEEHHTLPDLATLLIVSYRPHGAPGSEKRFTAYRHTTTGWQAVDGGWQRLYEARRMVANTTASKAVTQPGLVELLNRAITRDGDR